ncbi:MAG: glycosyltransferase [Gemmatimonadota bacterium]
MTIASAVLVCSVAVLAWTWFLYPAVMVALARLLPRVSPPDPTHWPHVSVVIASRDEPAAVSARLADVFAADYPPSRLDVVLAIDPSSSPERAAALFALAGDRVQVVPGDAPGGKSASVNAAVRASTGEVLVFTDTQQRFESAAIRALVRALLADARVTVVGGALHLPGDRPGASRSPVEWYWAGERLLRAAEARVHSTIGVSGSIYAMRASAWVPIPAGLILDDVFVPMQQVLQGARVAYTLDARAWDVRRTDHESERVRKVRTLTGNFQLMAWLPVLLVPFRNPVWLQFVSHKLLRLASPWVALVAGLSLVALLVRMLATVPLGWVLAAGTLVVGAVFLPPSGRRVRALARWVASLNGALVQASINGVRGRWDVW